MSIRYVLFDLDDTLVKTDSYLSSFVQSVSDYDLDQGVVESQWLDNTGLPLAQHYTQLLGCELCDPRVVVASEKFWQLAQDAGFTVLPGADQALRILYEQNYQLLLSTGSNPQRVDKILSEAGWSDLFVLPQGTTDDNPKGPAHYQRIYQYFDLTPEQLSYQAVSVGDGRYDVRYAKAHGLYAIAYTPQGTTEEQRMMLWDLGADQCLNDLRDLPDIISHL
jgi:phosphoglycolate phosphatase-like HAD superfamily hydrolase